MKLFGRKNKKEETQPCCGGSDSKQHSEQSEKMQPGDAYVKVLGSGCAKCNKLEAAAVEALKQLDMDSTIEHVTDFAQIAAYGVMSTPALVVNGKVVSYGKVLKAEEIVEILKKA